jgi:hypothetical protein
VFSGISWFGCGSCEAFHRNCGKRLPLPVSKKRSVIRGRVLVATVRGDAGKSHCGGFNPSPSHHFDTRVRTDSRFRIVSSDLSASCRRVLTERRKAAAPVFQFSTESEPSARHVKFGASRFRMLKS